MGTAPPPPPSAPSSATTQPNHTTAEVLARVGGGEHLVATWPGMVTAQPVPVSPHPSAPLIAAGVLHPAPQHALFPTRPRRPPPVRPP